MNLVIDEGCSVCGEPALGGCSRCGRTICHAHRVVSESRALDSGTPGVLCPDCARRRADEFDASGMLNQYGPAPEASFASWIVRRISALVDRRLDRKNK